MHLPLRGLDERLGTGRPWWPQYVAGNSVTKSSMTLPATCRGSAEQLNEPSAFDTRAREPRLAVRAPVLKPLGKPCESRPRSASSDQSQPPLEAEVAHPLADLAMASSTARSATRHPGQLRAPAAKVSQPRARLLATILARAHPCSHRRPAMRRHRPSAYLHNRGRGKPAHSRRGPGSTDPNDARQPKPSLPTARSSVTDALKGGAPVLLLVASSHGLHAQVVSGLAHAGRRGRGTLGFATARLVLAGHHPPVGLLVVDARGNLTTEDVTALVMHAAIRADAGRRTVFCVPDDQRPEPWVNALRRAFGESAVNVIRSDDQSDGHR